MASESSNYLVKVIDAAGKKKEAENKFRTEVAKARIQSALRRQERKAAIRENAGVRAQQDLVTNPQRYTPEQAYLRRRFLEQNPLAAMSVPEEGQEMKGVTYPSEEVVKQKDGTFAVSPLAPERQTQLLSTLVQKMVAQGKKPHPAIMKLLQTKMSSPADANYDPMTGKPAPGSKAQIEGVSQNQKEIDDIQSRLNFLQRELVNRMSSKDKKEKVSREMDQLSASVRKLLGYEIPQAEPPKKSFWESLFQGGKPPAQTFTAEEEDVIAENMKHHNKTREEIVSALSKRGLIGGKK